jgi:predicted deacylase
VIAVRQLRPFPFLATLVIVAASAAAADRAPFLLAGTEVPAGTQRAFVAEVAPGLPGVPITVFHGEQPGPVLTLSAGTHGDEFPAILALRELRAALRPEALRGVVVLVHAANLPSLHQRGLSPLHPADGKNLNRAFPGRADGSPTERLAHFLTEEIVGASDYLADLHSGSADQELWPHVYAPFVGDAALDARTLAFAKATGLRHVVLYGDRPRDPANSISYPNTAMTRGKPGLTLEIGDLGGREPEDVDAYLDALRRMLDHLGMLPGDFPEADGHVVYERLVDVETPAGGLFTAAVRIGELVGPGALLGTVTDYFGTPLAELRAPTRGVVLMLRHKPPVNAGDGLVTIGVEVE